MRGAETLQKVGEREAGAMTKIKWSDGMGSVMLHRQSGERSLVR